MVPVSEIKLIRTDTTLDLSQKAEKVCFPKPNRKVLITTKLNTAYGPTNHAVNQLAAAVRSLLREREGRECSISPVGQRGEVVK